MDKLQIRFILKNGAEFILKCNEFNCERTLGQITNISYKGYI